MASNFTLPNPTTPLAFLPPSLGTQLEVCRYVFAATVGAWLWDVLVSIHEEFRMCVGYRFKLSDAVYFLARILTGGFALSAFVFVVSPIHDCHMVAKLVGWFAALSLPCNCLLFLFRIRAVYHRNLYVIGFFGIMWLAILGSALLAPWSLNGVHIGTTQYCIPSEVTTNNAIGMIISAVNDTLVLVAITARLVMFSLADTWAGRIKIFLRGQGLGSVSKIVLQTGQIYYIATVGINIAAATIILIPSVPPVYRAMFSPPNVTIQNAMACRVYRQLKIGLIKDLSMTCESDNNAEGTIQFAVHPSNIRYSTRRRRGPDRYISDTAVTFSTIPEIVQIPNDRSNSDQSEMTEDGVKPSSEETDKIDLRPGVEEV
ncbi:hypothetical protein EIP91_002984 [Steccherinum ochraceum]|uniref:Uncharacterized protein n=1 Tax=Steccherinum ochraceum TaxID=92696 RepID=A0A4R0RMX0_9APHY|nr:hypothetical protein EIP91_002984 [Steccherinum ochraceum]